MTSFMASPYTRFVAQMIQRSVLTKITDFIFVVICNLTQQHFNDLKIIQFYSSRSEIDFIDNDESDHHNND